MVIGHGSTLELPIAKEVHILQFLHYMKSGGFQS